MIVYCVTWFKVKVKVMEVRKLPKSPISKSVSSIGIHVIKRLTVDYNTPRQYLNFSGQIFDIHAHSVSRDLQTERCKESIDSPVRGLFIYQSMTCRVVDHFCCQKEWTEQFVGFLMSRACVYVCVSYSGQVPARAEYNYLDRVRWLDMYGVVLHPVKVPHRSQH